MTLRRHSKGTSAGGQFSSSPPADQQAPSERLALGEDEAANSTTDREFWDELARLAVVDLTEDSRFVPACEGFVEHRKRWVFVLRREHRLASNPRHPRHKEAEDDFVAAHDDLFGMIRPFFERYEHPTRLALQDHRIECVEDSWGNQLHELRWMDERKWSIPQNSWWRM